MIPKTTRKTERTRRRVGVPHATIWPSDDPSSEIDLSNDLVALSTNKNITSPTGEWSMNLLPRAGEGQSKTDLNRLSRIYGSVEANNVVSIGFNQQGGVMAGLVSSIHRTSHRVGNKVVRGLTLTGKDMGKVLTQDQVVRAVVATRGAPGFYENIKAELGPGHPLLAYVALAFGPEHLLGGISFEGAGVEDVIRWIIDATPSMRLPLMSKLTGGGPFRNGVNFGHPREWMKTDKSITSWHDNQVFQTALSMYQGRIIDFIKATLDPDFYEIWIDSVPTGKKMPEIHLIVRPKPYDERGLDWMPVTTSPGNSWEDLRTMVNGDLEHIISEGEVFDERLGFGDSDAISHYKVTAAHELVGNVEAEKAGLQYPLIDLWNVKRHGLKSYNTRLNLVSGDTGRKVQDDAGNYVGEVVTEVRDFRNRLFNWYRLNPYFETGSITVVGRDEFRVGDPVKFPHIMPARGGERGMRYYTTGVHNSWRYGGQFKSTLQVSRGHNAAMVKNLKEMIRSEALNPVLNPNQVADS